MVMEWEDLREEIKALALAVHVWADREAQAMAAPMPNTPGGIAMAGLRMRLIREGLATVERDYTAAIKALSADERESLIAELDELLKPRPYKRYKRFSPLEYAFDVELDA
jgi:hypothetical protein